MNLFKLSGLAGLAFIILSTGQAHALTGKYEQTVSMNGQKMASFDITVKEDKVRAHSKYLGQDEITIRNAEGTFRFLPAQKVIFKLPDEVNQTNLLDDIDEYDAFLEKHNAVLKSTEEFDGKMCDVYEFTDPISGGLTRSWVWTERKFPIRIEVDAPEGQIVVAMHNIDLDSAVEDDNFALPENVKSVSVEEMLAAMREQTPIQPAEAPAE